MKIGVVDSGPIRSAGEAPLLALSVNGLLYFYASASFDSGAVGDHLRVAPIKALETDLSYPAVGLSDYAGMTPIATCSC